MENSTPAPAAPAHHTAHHQGWNTYLEKEIVRYHQKAWCYKVLHRMGSEYYSKWDWVLTVFIMAVSISSLFPNQDDYVYIVITAVATGLVGFQKMAGYSKLEQQHSSASNNYSKFVTQQRNLLNVYRRDRPYAKQYIEFISSTYDELANRGPSIEWVIIKMFQTKYKNRNIFMPDILSDNIDVLERGIDGSDTHSEPSKIPTKTATVHPVLPATVGREQDDFDAASAADDSLEGAGVAGERVDYKTRYELNRLHDHNSFMPISFPE